MANSQIKTIFKLKFMLTWNIQETKIFIYIIKKNYSILPGILWWYACISVSVNTEPHTALKLRGKSIQEALGWKKQEYLQRVLFQPKCDANIRYQVLPNNYNMVFSLLVALDKYCYLFSTSLSK